MGAPTPMAAPAKTETAAVATGSAPSAAQEVHAWTPAQRAALWLSYVSYATCMLCKAAVDVAVPAAQLDPAMALSHAATAKMLAAGAWAYTIGKLVGGSVSDLLGGGRTLATTSLVTAAALAVMSRAHSLRTITVAWALARLFMAAGYPAGTAVIGRNFGGGGGGGSGSGSGLGFALGIFSTSSRAGAVVGAVGLGTLLSPAFGLSWRGVLGMSGVLSLAVGATVGISPALRNHGPEGTAAPADGVPSSSLPSSPSPSPPALSPSPSEAVVITKTAAEGLLALAKSGRLWLTFASTACLGPAFDFGALLPLYLTQTHGLSPASAAVVSGAYPMGAAVSLVVSGTPRPSRPPRSRPPAEEREQAWCSHRPTTCRPPG